MIQLINTDQKLADFTAVPKRWMPDVVA